MSSIVIKDLKDLVNNIIDARMMADIELATVIKDGEELKYQLGDLTVLPKKAVIVPASFGKMYGKTKSGESVTIDNSLQEDDNVILLRADKGQHFVVIGRQK